MKIVALLESMYGWRGFHTPGAEAPRYFRINPRNFTGRRLYRICGATNRLLVTDSCREVQASANHHGKPDPEWVRANLEFLKSQGMDLLLVCGKIASETFDKSGFVFPNVIRMDHPAARRWTNEKLDQIKDQIAAYETKTNL